MAASRTRRPSVRAADPADRLVYVSGGELALRRERRDGQFVIVDADGVSVTGGETLGRVGALRIPPAWTGVWISTAPNAHVQATGLDAKGRRQYLYHPLWRLRRDEEKFDDMLEFAERLPDVRAVARGLLASGSRGSRAHARARCGCSTSACSVSVGTATRATTDTSG